MLTKYKNVGTKKDVKSLLQNVFMSAAYSEFFSGRGHQIFDIFLRVIFFLAELF